METRWMLLWKIREIALGKYIFFLTFSAELCKYNERSGQSKTRMGKLWLNGAAKFLTSLTNVRFFTFFKSISTLLYNSSVYFNQRPSLVVLMLIQDLFQAPANPERNGEKNYRTFFDNCYWNFILKYICIFFISFHLLL